jgi:hypothetical protein
MDIKTIKRKAQIIEEMKEYIPISKVENYHQKKATNDYSGIYVPRDCAYEHCRYQGAYQPENIPTGLHIFLEQESNLISKERLDNFYIKFEITDRQDWFFSKELIKNNTYGIHMRQEFASLGFHIAIFENDNIKNIQEKLKAFFEIYRIIEKYKTIRLFD